MRVTRSGKTGCVPHSLTVVYPFHFLRRQLAAERSDDTVIQSQAHRLTQKGESWAQLCVSWTRTKSATDVDVPCLLQASALSPTASYYSTSFTG